MMLFIIVVGWLFIAVHHWIVNKKPALAALALLPIFAAGLANAGLCPEWCGPIVTSIYFACAFGYWKQAVAIERKSAAMANEPGVVSGNGSVDHSFRIKRKRPTGRAHRR